MAEKQRKLTGKQIAANAADPNHCYYDGVSNIFNLREIRQHFCRECGAPGKLTIIRPAPVLKHCDKHGTELVEIREVCTRRNEFKHRLKRYLLLGFSHMNEHRATVHIDLAHKLNYIKGNE